MTDVSNVLMGQGSRSTDELPVILFGQSGDAIVQTARLKSSRKRDMDPAQETLGCWDQSIARKAVNAKIL